MYFVRNRQCNLKLPCRRTVRKQSYCRYAHLWGIYRVMQSILIPTLRSCKNLSILVSPVPRNLTHHFIRESSSSCSFSHYDFAIVASAPLAFTTQPPEFCAGIATGRPRAFDVKATISLSIRSRVSLVRSSTSEGFRFFVSIGFKT
jgi:hypothetical protein